MQPLTVKQLVEAIAKMPTSIRVGDLVQVLKAPVVAPPRDVARVDDSIWNDLVRRARS